jgi:membrane-associated protease RseP (regulator of RpoE activity)
MMKQIYATILILTVLTCMLCPADVVAGSVDDPVEMLGITEMSCFCSQTIEGKKTYWTFQSEPEIRKVRKGGPSDGKLEKGDRIVALDGFLITTHQAGVLFANVQPGEPVTLTVSRKGDTREVTVVPERTERRYGSAVRGFDSTGAWTIPELSVAIEDLAIRAGDLSMEFEPLEIPEIPPIPSLDFKFDFDFVDAFPRGWFGFGLSMSGSIKHEDDVARWRFNDPPKIKSIEEGSPAALAGLKEGDRLTHIDGSKLDSRRGGRKFSEVEPGQDVTFKYKRGRESHEVTMTAVERPPRPPRQPLIGTYGGGKTVYTGQFGTTSVNVTGSKQIKVYTDPETGELVIKTRDGVVRLKDKDKED